MIASKKGDIPITILVIGVFMICALALLSFYSSNIEFGSSFYGIASMGKINGKINEYYFYKNLGIDEKKIKEIIDIKEDNLGKYILIEEKIEEKKFIFIKYSEKVLFSVRYNFPG